MDRFTLEKVYGNKGIDAQKKRYSTLIGLFGETFGEKPQRLFSASGRTEVCGNHTDHNCGCVLAAGVSLDVIAAVTPTDDGVITFTSEGFGTDVIDTGDLEAGRGRFFRRTDKRRLLGLCTKRSESRRL